VKKGIINNKDNREEVAGVGFFQLDIRQRFVGWGNWGK